ncbi:MAG: ATP-binding protein [bacterium]
MNLSIALNTEKALRSCAEGVRAILDAEAVFIFLSDTEDRQKCSLAAESARANEFIPMGPRMQIAGDFKTVWQNGTPLVDVSLKSAFPPSQVSDTWTVLRLGLQPLPFGLLIALRRDRPPNSADRIDEALVLLEQSLPDLHEAWVRWLVKCRSASLRSLVDITTGLASSLDRDVVLGKVVQQTAILLSAKLCSLLLLDPTGKELILESAYGCSVEYLMKPNLPVLNSLLGRAVRDSEVIRVPDVRENSEYLHREMAIREVLCSLLAAPVQFADKVLGVLCIYSASRREWSEQDEDLLRAVASSAAVAIQNASLVDKVAGIEQKASEAMRLSTLGEMTASLAHQIRNPLAVVNMLIHSWETLTLPKQIQADLRVISENINGLNRIVEGALALARGQRPRPMKCDLNEIIDGLLLLLRYQIREHRVHFINEFSTECPPLVADHDQVEQALLNLIVNAVQVVPEGGKIGVRGWKTPETTEIEVWDNGPGVAPEIRKTLFEAFTTTKPGGLGLGLSVVHRIVRDHGGEITVKDRPEGGTSFVLHFPI